MMAPIVSLKGNADNNAGRPGEEGVDESGNKQSPLPRRTEIPHWSLSSHADIRSMQATSDKLPECRSDSKGVIQIL